MPASPLLKGTIIFKKTNSTMQHLLPQSNMIEIGYINSETSRKIQKRKIQT
jgi:hypothetical protein